MLLASLFCYRHGNVRGYRRGHRYRRNALRHAVRRADSLHGQAQEEQRDGREEDTAPNVRQ